MNTTQQVTFSNHIELNRFRHTGLISSIQELQTFNINTQCLFTILSMEWIILK